MIMCLVCGFCKNLRPSAAEKAALRLLANPQKRADGTFEQRSRARRTRLLTDPRGRRPTRFLSTTLAVFNLFLALPRRRGQEVPALSSVVVAIVAVVVVSR